MLIVDYFYKNNSFTFHFVDEEYNFAIGKYLLKNDILYNDILTNHQPLTHILSSVVQEYSKPNNIFMLVTRHREFIILWSTIWSLILVLYFGSGALIFILIYELSKSYLFGNLFLAEAIIVYPLLFLVGLVVYNKCHLSGIELFFTGICIALTLFLLGPIWPVIIFLVILLIYRQRISGQKGNLINTFLYLTLSILIITLFISKYTSLPGYIHYYFITNLTYTVPSYHSSYYNGSWGLILLKSFLTPLISFMESNISPILLIIRTLSLLLIINLLSLIKRKKINQAAIITALLGMTNIRFVAPGSEHYNGFHLLPWYTIFIFITSAILVQNYQQNKHILFRVANLGLVIIVFILSLKYADSAIFTKRSIQRDYLISYSTMMDRGEIIKIMKNPNDTLFISSDAWLIYWQSDVPHIPKLFGYYAWMAGIPSLNSAILEIFNKKPPTFFYCDNCKGLSLEKFLTKYSEIKQNKGGTQLYILSTKAKSLTQSQLTQLKLYNVNFD